MKIYTKKGDSGETHLFGGKKVWKDDLRINAYGSVDELNAILGIAVTEINDKELTSILQSIQSELFTLGADLAAPKEIGNGTYIPRVDENYYKRLEVTIDKYENELPVLKNFILPGGSKGASLLHTARTVCRRAERNVVSLAKDEEVGYDIIVYLNRLSDLLFVLSRVVNHRNGIEDIIWQKP